MADENTASPETRMDEEEESASSNLPSTEPAFGGSFAYGLPGVMSRPHSKQPSRMVTPSRQHVPSGHAFVMSSGHAMPSSSIFEAYRVVQDTKMDVLRNGLAAAIVNVQMLMKFSNRVTQQLSQSHETMIQHMAEQFEGLRLHIDVPMATFAQTVEAHVLNAVQASTTAANMANVLAGQYLGI
jgi:hypothetical protein